VVVGIGLVLLILTAVFAWVRNL